MYSRIKRFFKLRIDPIPLFLFLYIQWIREDLGRRGLETRSVYDTVQSSDSALELHVLYISRCEILDALSCA